MVENDVEMLNLSLNLVCFIRFLLTTYKIIIYFTIGYSDDEEWTLSGLLSNEKDEFSGKNGILKVSNIM